MYYCKKCQSTSVYYDLNDACTYCCDCMRENTVLKSSHDEETGICKTFLIKSINLETTQKGL